MRPDRRVTDTSDAVMLAAACTSDQPSIAQLRDHRQRKDVRAGIGWLTKSFADERTAAARRVERHFEIEFGRSGGAAWAVEASERFARALGKVS